jgi:DNA repair photolyase
MQPPIYKPKGRALEYAEWAVNIYSGCGPGICSYCFAPRVLHKTISEFSRPQAREGFLEALEAQAAKFDSGGKRILLSFVCDPYQPLDFKLKLTRSTIEILHQYGHAVQVLTKGGLYALRDLDLFGKADAFATTLTLLDDFISVEWEPWADIPEARIHAIRKFHQAGIETWVSLEPVLDPAVSLEIIRRTSDIVDLFKVGKWNYDPRAAAIDWHRFALDAKALLDSLGKSYYFKRDLLAYLSEAEQAAFNGKDK